MNERILFEAAIEISGPSKRRAFLEKACEGNPELLAKVTELLASHEAAGSFLEESPIRPPEARQTPDRADGLEVTEAERDSLALKASEIAGFLDFSSSPGSNGRLAHYEVLTILGQGGFGTVLKAFDEKLHRPVAIKMLSPQLAATSPPRKRFVREARAVAAIKHENIVQVYSVEEQPLPYIVMEFVDGATLQDKIDATGPIDVPELLHLARQMAAGLSAAHDKGLIHRDIKPGNILIESGADQRVKITDFGLARAADDASLTQSGTIAGTPMYMAPEQATGARIDHRADLFSLGSVLYAMACGHPPFRAGSTLAVLRRVTDDTPRPLQEVLPELPDALVAIIDRLLQKNPDNRFQTAREVANLLSRCQSQLHVDGTMPTLTALGLLPASPAPEVLAASLPPATPSQEPRRRSLWAYGALMASILTGLFLLEHQGVSHLTPLSRPRAEQVASTSYAVPDRRTHPDAPPPTTLAAADPDRAVAEWALVQPGEKHVRVVGEGRDLTVQRVDELPSHSFSVVAVQIKDAELTDEALARLGELHALETLQISVQKPQLRLTDTGLRNLFSLSVCKTLGRFVLHLSEQQNSIPNLTAEGLLSLNQAQSLLHLEVNGLSVHQSDFVAQLRLPSLRSLVLSHRWQDVASGGMFHKVSSRMPALVRLVALNQFQLDQQDIEGISRLDALESLELLDAGVDDRDLETLSRMTGLKALHLVNQQISDQGLAQIGKLTALESLMLHNNPRITDAGIAHLASLKGLKFVGINHVPLTSEACKTLATLPLLESASLYDTRIDDAGLESLSTSKTLSRIGLGDCKRITDQGLESLAKSRSLTWLDIKANPQLTEAAVRRLQAALPNCTVDSNFPNPAAPAPAANPAGSDPPPP